MPEKNYYSLKILQEGLSMDKESFECVAWTLDDLK